VDLDSCTKLLLAGKVLLAAVDLLYKAELASSSAGVEGLCQMRQGRNKRLSATWMDTVETVDL